jgi:hypothetical protein
MLNEGNLGNGHWSKEDEKKEKRERERCSCVRQGRRFFSCFFTGSKIYDKIFAYLCKKPCNYNNICMFLEERSTDLQA